MPNEGYAPAPVPVPAGVKAKHREGGRSTDSLTETEKFILEMLERLDEANTTAENLKRALENSRDIGAAVGVLMAFAKVSQNEAFEMLRRTSQDQNRKLYAVAREVITTGELPSRGKR